MAIHYSINPKFDLIIYVCKGLITASEFFKIQDLAALEKDYKKSGMTAIIDLLSASVDFELQDFHHVIDFAKKPGFQYGQTAILSQNRGIHLSVNTLNLLSHGVDLKLSSFDSIDNAISSLGLSDNMKEIIQFWNESKSGK